jgi:hypothetical protein
MTRDPSQSPERRFIPDYEAARAALLKAADQANRYFEVVKEADYDLPEDED